ncbi:alpha/beta hydrolase [Paraburkholderia strydomiana]|uniref:Alpha/beta hydrolase n=1 Tax=Paraburkholderia strydomiana TaxID=1245417 RepID=A0ABW9ERK6_9BURK
MNEIKRLETTVRGQTISYLELGDGPRTLLLLHGITSDASNWLSTMPALAQRGWRVIAPDQLGFGQSSKPSVPVRPRTLSDMVAPLLDALGVDMVSIVGQSMGGHVAGLFAAQYPERVEALVLVNAGYGLALPEVKDPRDLGHAVTPGGLWALNPATRDDSRRLLEMVFHDQGLVTEELIDGFYADRLGKGDGAVIRSISESWARREDTLESAFTGLERRPVLVIQARQDKVAPYHLGRAIHEGIAGSRFVVLEDCGHAPPLEAPEVFNKTLTEFLV